MTRLIAPFPSVWEQAVIDRFEGAPDPWAEDLTHPLQGKLVMHAGIVFEGYTDTGEDRRVTEDLYEAQAVASRAVGVDRMQEWHPSEAGGPAVPEGGWHYPVLDLDLPVYVVPSSTPGHSHVYIDALLPWAKYCKLLDVLAECGLVEEGYVAASKARGHTALRLPWVRKWANDQPTTWAELTAPSPFDIEDHDE